VCVVVVVVIAESRMEGVVVGRTVAAGRTAVVAGRTKVGRRTGLVPRD
jgi:hypothetical protein